MNEICADVEMVISKIPESWKSYQNRLQHASRGYSADSKQVAVDLILPEVSPSTDPLESVSI